MRKGMHAVRLQAGLGRSRGPIGLWEGRNEGGAMYDGECVAGDNGQTRSRIKIPGPPEVMAVLGACSPEVWSIDLEISASLPSDGAHGWADTPHGVPTGTVYRFLQPISPGA